VYDWRAHDIVSRGRYRLSGKGGLSVMGSLMSTDPHDHHAAELTLLSVAGAGIDVVWPQFLLVAGIGGLFLFLAIFHFRSTASVVA
jgi:hypothetical protein